MNIYLIVILIILAGGYLLNLVVEVLNISRVSSNLPGEFVGYYDPNQYRRSQDYLKDKTYFSLIYSGLVTSVFIFFILSGAFNFLDLQLRALDLPLILTGLLFALVIFIVLELVNLPFSAYNTFALEKRFGFNKTTLGTFILDKLKSFIITVILGSLILSFAIWFFYSFPVWGWVFCWLGFFLFELFLLYIWPRYIMPLFNKFEPIEPGLLYDKIKNYADSQDFKIKGIYKMDASRRSTKANAFFAGFGKFKRVVLFDTLIDNHNPDEIIAILAHEIGHYRKKHLLKMLGVSFLTNGLMFYILSLFISDPFLFKAFRMEQVSVYAGLFFFGFLYAPINALLALFINWFSRKNEREADFYVVSTAKLGEEFIDALKKLSVKNLSNLAPHPLKVALSYSHPPILERIRYIRRYINNRTPKP